MTLSTTYVCFLPVNSLTIRLVLCLTFSSPSSGQFRFTVVYPIIFFFFFLYHCSISHTLAYVLIDPAVSPLFCTLFPSLLSIVCSLVNKAQASAFFHFAKGMNVARLFFAGSNPNHSVATKWKSSMVLIKISIKSRICPSKMPFSIMQRMRNFLPFSGLLKMSPICILYPAVKIF